MGKLADFLTGTKILEEVFSPINGKIQVVKSLAFGTYIQVGGLTQSGGVVYDVWKTSLKRVQQSLVANHRTLILGLGGGSTAKLVRKFWGDDVEIVGVDIDPIMVELGRRYFDLDSYNVKVVIDDAGSFLAANYQIPTKRFDLVLVDLYIGDEFPKKFESEDFLKHILKLLNNHGIAVFNRLYYGEKRKDAMNFLKTLERVFKEVEVVYPEANILFLCSNPST